MELAASRSWPHAARPSPLPPGSRSSPRVRDSWPRSRTAGAGQLPELHPLTEANPSISKTAAALHTPALYPPCNSSCLPSSVRSHGRAKLILLNHKADLPLPALNSCPGSVPPAREPSAPSSTANTRAWPVTRAHLSQQQTCGQYPRGVGGSCPSL